MRARYNLYSVFIGSDMNGHVGRDADGYGDVHGGMGRLYKLITYQTGDNRGMIDCLMVMKTDHCLVKDVKVISSEEGVPQHRTSEKHTQTLRGDTGPQYRTFQTVENYQGNRRQITAKG